MKFNLLNSHDQNHLPYTYSVFDILQQNSKSISVIKYEVQKYYKTLIILYKHPIKITGESACQAIITIFFMPTSEIVQIYQRTS